MGFWGWVGLIFFTIVGWNLIQWGIRVNDEAKAEEEAKAARKRVEDAKNEMARIRNEVIRDLNKTWNERCLEYIEALKSGDKFLATAKGRDFYSCNRRYSGSRIQSQVITDEIRIKNEVAKGRLDHVDPLRLEELDNEGLRDRLEFLTK
ncbi:MAG: hypothetical protein ACOYB0_06615 [Polynucleobacter sp.]|uniref:hypothetical protein n=1 Tax=Polynucleobacter sp. MWH-Aus1W21 TaxID=1855880 RepID=UPI001BFDD8B8|nr:hypothetical protein [Polynucleobacter sp. MWH-Aus1W21]QWD65483.1 hypothetical protein ICW03_07420 [Polynucleobacter sp. MWH-Aus1W21]